GAGLVHAGRAAGEDQPLRVQRPRPVGGDVVPDHLAEDVQLPHPAGDQLPELGAEVEDQDEFRIRCGSHSGASAGSAQWAMASFSSASPVTPPVLTNRSKSTSPSSSTSISHRSPGTLAI